MTSTGVELGMVSSELTLDRGTFLRQGPDVPCSGAGWPRFPQQPPRSFQCGDSDGGSTSYGE